MNMRSPYGYFSSNNTFITTRPDTPRAFDNFLWNDAAFACVQQTGVGYFDYQVDGKEATKLMTGEGRICDFDIFGRDAMMSRLIYIRDNDTGEFWNLNWEPVCHAYDRYECEHGIGYTDITSSTHGIASRLRIFIPDGKDPVEMWTVSLRNESDRLRNVSIFFYNQISFAYKWGFNSYGDMIFRNSYFDAGNNAVVATKHPHVSPHSYQTGFLTSELSFDYFDGTRDAFVGVYGGLHRPQAVVNGQCSNTPGSSDSTVLVGQINRTLAPSEKLTFDALLGVTDSSGGIAELKEKYLGRADEHFAKMLEARSAPLLKESIQTPDEQLNRIINHWAKHQTHYGATWCRWGWMGYRDIVQHGFGVSSFDSDRTRCIIMDALRYQYRSGLAIRGWNPIDEKSYSDSALWLIFTITAYLKETGDFKLMDETIPFYDEGEGSVWEHFDAVLDFLETNKGAHGLCLIKYGDWNDSLTGVGKQGHGESVWLSMAYARALTDVAELYAYLGNERKEQAYMERYESMKKALNQEAWDGEWYVRCFDDDGRAIGSAADVQGRIFANAQSWALISGIVDEQRSEQLLKSCDDHLLTELGYLLLDPTFTEPDDRIGRISYLEPGICENGTIYTHVNAFMIWALLLDRRAERAYDLFKRITPGYDSENHYKEESPPYIYANCYFGPEHRNRAFQMEFTWMTGSVAWMYQVVVRYLVGVRADYEGLIIDPQLPAEWDEVHVSKTYRGVKYEITVKQGDEYESRQIQIDGELHTDSSGLIPLMEVGQSCRIEVTQPAMAECALRS
ncbi:GH36-type glycosyl hydrolase domain-containing protein [Cerasicoccus maritimus]|uniref:GH36-type glycosyl hydrolase domain-containing protein n=1 Tax=Cerasicoccus maritimus TaxID=490089 RepID=UPI0028528676|nr:hypothetical protein [Cerasicoccus maritimus]